MRTLEMTGQRFGRLVVGAYLARGWWECACDCGEIKAVRGGHLRAGLVKSCGCYRREAGRTMMTDLRRSQGLAPMVGSRAAHNRVDRARGKASAHQCVDCERPAKDWSFDHLVEPDAITAEGPYSLDVNAYSPRCRVCHKALDNAQKTRD